jgi:hypothetical protein
LRFAAGLSVISTGSGLTGIEVGCCCGEVSLRGIFRNLRGLRPRFAKKLMDLKRQSSNFLFNELAEWNVALRGSRKETREETREETTSSINFEEGIVAAERSVQAAAE